MNYIKQFFNVPLSLLFICVLSKQKKKSTWSNFSTGQDQREKETKKNSNEPTLFKFRLLMIEHGWDCSQFTEYTWRECKRFEMRAHIRYRICHGMSNIYRQNFNRETSVRYTGQRLTEIHLEIRTQHIKHPENGFADSMTHAPFQHRALEMPFSGSIWTSASCVYRLLYVSFNFKTIRRLTSILTGFSKRFRNWRMPCWQSGECAQQPTLYNCQAPYMETDFFVFEILCLWNHMHA